MKRYADVDYTIKALSIFSDKKNSNQHFLNGIETAKEVINNQPTADVRENIRGKWKIYCDDKGVVQDCYCDQCGFNSVIGGYFCPNCGADMRGGDAE